MLNVKRQGETQLRVRIIFGLLVLFFIVIIYRLYELQVLEAHSFQALAENQQGLNATLSPSRGEIKVYDKFSPEPFPVAVNIKKPLLYAVPNNIEDKAAAASDVALKLGLDREDVFKKISQSNKAYVPLKKELSSQEQEYFEKSKMKGLNIDFETSRFYPEQEFLSNVIGFTAFSEKSGSRRVGVYGLERAFESELAGQSGKVRSHKDAKGLWLFGGREELVPPQDGVQLILNVDRTIQLAAERVLKQTVDQHQADGGCVIVINPKNGAVLAMASSPTYNPNVYSKVEDPKVYQNLCTQGGYEPGSVFKPLVMAAALDAGAIESGTTFEDKGVEEISGFQIKNSDNKAHGKQDMVQVLEKSLNTGMIFVERQLGHNRFKSYVQKFGFGKATGIEVLERPGSLDNLKGNIELNYATSAFGQGLLVTPIQMVRAYTALANKGMMVEPSLVQARVAPGGKVLQEKEAQDQTQVISPKTAATTSAMLVSVVENGHGKRAGVKGYYIAGKTGTAQVAKQAGKGYDPNNNIGTFIGYGPVEDPMFVMLVRIDHPRTVLFAESTAAPAFGELANFILSYYNIPPTR